MGLYRACFRVQDGDHRYVVRRWIEAGDREAAQEIAGKWVEVMENSTGEYRACQLQTVDTKDTVIAQVRETSSGMTEDSVDNLLEYVDRGAS